jgi:hypothetical protein
MWKNGIGEKHVQVSGGKARRKIPLERPRRRWEDGFKMALGCLAGALWSGFTWLRIGTVGGDEPWGSSATGLVG